MSVRSFLLLVGAGAILADSAPTVQITNGTLEGGKCASTDVNYFLSIPYAAPPVGELRFAASQPFDKKYNGTRNATIAAPACPQFGTQFLEYGPQSEDCLFLDIWAPSSASSGDKLPVRVWLFGGGNDDGGISNALYNGCSSSSDSILVSVNYRLGALGYLSVEAAGVTGNYGLQDQILALKWIQENIEAFGGDKSQVMLFGQSAGADDTFVISTLPVAKTLIQSAVLESGGGRDLATLAETKAFNEGYVTALNCGVSDISCLRSKSMGDFNVTFMTYAPAGTLTSDSLLEHLGLGGAWGPIVDGIVVAKQPSDVGVQVPSIIGTTSQEGTLFALGEYQGAVTTLNQTDYDRFLAYNFGPFGSIINTAYALSKFNSSPVPVFTAMSTIVTEYGYRCPSYRAILGAIKNGQDVWTYRFNHTSSCAWLATLPKSVLSIAGPTHTIELPYVFGVEDGMPVPGGNCSLTDAEKATGKYIRAAWTNMAAKATPGGDWPKFTANGSKGINFNDAPAVGVIDYSTCAFWDQIAAQVSQYDANQTARTNTSSGGNSSGTGSGSSKPNGAAAARYGPWNAVSLALGLTIMFVVGLA